MSQQDTSNKYHNICLCGEIEKIAILSVYKLAISGAMYVAKYFFYFSMKTLREMLQWGFRPFLPRKVTFTSLG